MSKLHYFDGLKSSLLVDTSNSDWQWTPLPLKAETDAGIAPADAYLSVGDIYRGVVPFIALQLLMLALVALFPALATALPTWLYR